MAGRGTEITPIREATDLMRYGTKAQSLAMLASSGFPVPDAFCIAADAYREHAERAGVAALVAILRGVPASAPPVTLTPILQRIRSSIIHTPLDPDTVEAIRAGFGDMGPSAVSVRSSVTAADMAGGPLVGRHGTYFVPGFHEALHAITHCWTSLWGDLAWRDREAAGLADADVAVAVVIQRLIAASSSGVVFTADPATGDSQRVIVESCYGLGEAIVAGKVKPDRFVLAREGLSLTDSDVHTKPVQLVLDESGRVVQRIVSPDHAAAASITPYEVREIAALALNVESALGGAVCVEWARSGGATSLLQARPLIVGR